MYKRYLVVSLKLLTVTQEMDIIEAEALVKYIVTKEYPKDFSKNDKRRLREKSLVFSVKEGVLFHIGVVDKKGSAKKVCIW